MRCRARKARLASLIEGGVMAVGHDGGSFPRLCHCEEGEARRGDPFPGEQKRTARRRFLFYQSLSSLRTAMNASVGTWTVPRFRIFFLPSFCFSSSFFLRVMSPP